MSCINNNGYWNNNLLGQNCFTNVNGQSNTNNVLGQSCNYPRVSLINSNNLKFGTVIPNNKYYNGGLLTYNLKGSGNGNLVHLGATCGDNDLSFVYVNFDLCLNNNKLMNVSEIESSNNIVLSKTSISENLTVPTIKGLNFINDISGALSIDGLIIPTRIDFSNHNVRIGKDTGLTHQGLDAIAIGFEAGKTSQGINAIAIGGNSLDVSIPLSSMSSAGYHEQGENAIAIGTSSGVYFQQDNAIAIGRAAGNYDQSSNAIAIGFKAGEKNQGFQSIAIGYNAGNENQGVNSIAIGNNAGVNNQHNNTIILNASDISLNTVNPNSFYIHPLRQDNDGLNVYYNPTTKEITYRETLVTDTEKGLDFNGSEIDNVSQITGNNLIINTSSNVTVTNNLQILDMGVSLEELVFPHIDMSLNGLLTLETDKTLINPTDKIGFTFITDNNDFYDNHILKSLMIKIKAPNIANSNVVLKNYLELVYTESPYVEETIIGTKTITSEMFNFFDVAIDISFNNLNLKINSTTSNNTAPILYLRLKNNGIPLYDIQFLVPDEFSYKDPNNSILSYFMKRWSPASINITSLIASNFIFSTTPNDYVLSVSKIFIDNKGGIDLNNSDLTNVSSINSDNNININSKDDLIINSNVVVNGYIKNNSGYFANVLGSAKEMFPLNDCNTSAITNLIDLQKYKGAIYAPNGNIYCIPYDSNNILIINSNTLETKYITNVPINGYSSGVIANNRKIYCAPNKPNNNKILVIDTNNDTIYYLSGLVTVNQEQWCGGVLATNDKIYFIQSGHHSVLVLNTLNEHICYLSNPINGIKQWVGGVLAPNGFIYCIPHNSNVVAIINPFLNSNNVYTNLIINVGSINNGNWAGGVLGQNGFIYGIPHNNNHILKIDPNNNNYNLINIDYPNINLSEKWFGGTLAPNGTIYMMPYKSPDMLLYDPITETTLILSDVGTGTSDWIGSILVSNGKVFGIPYNNHSVLIIKTGIPLYNNWMIAPEFNKL